MFTGIVRELGVVMERRGSRLEVQTGLACRLGDSVAVNGACLTVSAKRGGKRRAAAFDVSPETYRLTNLGELRAGSRVNLEPALRLGDDLGGHMMSGHVDGRGRILARQALRDGSVRLAVELPRRLKGLVALKGSVAVDGVSLTVTALSARAFETVLVPHTLGHTNLGARKAGETVNLEADALARYVQAALHAR